MVIHYHNIFLWYICLLKDTRKTKDVFGRLILKLYLFRLFTFCVFYQWNVFHHICSKNLFGVWWAVLRDCVEGVSGFCWSVSVGTVVRWDAYKRKSAMRFMDLQVWEIALAAEGRYRQNSDPHPSMFGFQVLLKSSSAEGMISSRNKYSDCQHLTITYHAFSFSGQ